MLGDKHIAHTHLYPTVISCWIRRSGSTLTVSWCGLDRVVWHKCHSMVTLLGHKVWNLVISHFLRISCPNFASCQHSMIYVQQCQYQENVEWVTKFTSTIFPLPKYSMILFESCLFLCCRAALQSLCWSLFNCWNSSLIPAHTVFNKPGDLLYSCYPSQAWWNTYILYDYAPTPSVRGHYLNSRTGRTQFPTCSDLMNPLRMSIWSINSILGRVVPLLLEDSYVRAF